MAGAAHYHEAFDKSQWYRSESDGCLLALSNRHASRAIVLDGVDSIRSLVMTHRPLILLEFNELSPDLMERFIGMGCLPNFQRLHDGSQVYITEAEERGWELNPWVQWVTVHSGLNHRDHGIIELDEGSKIQGKRVSDVVNAAGFPVCLWGSMNVAYGPNVAGVVLPDPWTTKVAPYPATLQPFFRFVQQNVLEHASGRVPLAAADYAAFATFMLAHGMSLATVTALVRQLVDERFSSPDQHWKRAVLLDKLQFDVFRWYYRKTRPLFSTFFSNSTAHFQHFHWREMEPHLFTHRPSSARLAAHEHTILFGYQEMDKLIGRFLDLAGPDATIVFATAISQQPCLVYEEQGGKVMYRPADVSRLVRFAGVTEACSSAPLMAEVFNLRFQSEVDAVRAEAMLRALRVDGRPAMHVQRDGTQLTTKCQVHDQLEKSARISRGDGGPSMPFFEMFYQLEDSKSGMHHPDGMLWIRTPGQRHQKHAGKLPLAAVAPTLLELMGMPVPPHMTTSPAGASRAVAAV